MRTSPRRQQEAVLRQTRPTSLHAVLRARTHSGCGWHEHLVFTQVSIGRRALRKKENVHEGTKNKAHGSGSLLCRRRRSREEHAAEKERSSSERARGGNVVGTRAPGRTRTGRFGREAPTAAASRAQATIAGRSLLQPGKARAAPLRKTKSRQAPPTVHGGWRERERENSERGEGYCSQRRRRHGSRSRAPDADALPDHGCASTQCDVIRA